MTVIDSSVTVGDQEVKLFVEADEMHKPVGTAFGQKKDDARKAADRREDVFGQGLDLAAAAAQRCAQTMEMMAEDVRPDNFQVQFGIRLDGDTGAVITKAKGGAHLNVTMSWKKAGVNAD
ncbi:MAG: CU044_2847 family protein [Acidobacteriota bacterium]|nr:CU044_2847 family protein [Acidobacteriota bacterium]